MRRTQPPIGPRPHCPRGIRPRKGPRLGYPAIRLHIERSFTIHEYTEGLQHRWSDRKNRPLESRINEIIVALVRISVTVVRPRRLEAHRARQRRLEEERRWMREQARLLALEKEPPGVEQPGAPGLSGRPRECRLEAPGPDRRKRADGTVAAVVTGLSRSDRSPQLIRCRAQQQRELLGEPGKLGSPLGPPGPGLRGA